MNHAAISRPLPADLSLEARPAWRLGVALAVLGLALLLAGLAAGAQGWSWDWTAERELLLEIRAPRTLGAWCAGALLGLAGAVAQGLFRNPLADPYLLGAAAGAGLAVTLVLAAGGALGLSLGVATVASLGRLSVFGAAFAGALAGVFLTLMLARGAGRPTVLLLAGVVVGVVMTAVADLAVVLAPDALRGRQVFLLGTTSFLGWGSVAWLVATLALALPVALLLSRALDALVLGEDTASSLGLPLPRLRMALVALVALATGATVAQVGLVAFVGLVAPHLVRRMVTVPHRALLALSALAGGALLTAADVLSRVLVAPQELPVGVITALIGGVYLLVLLRRGGPPAP